MDHKGLWQAVLGELEVSVSRANFATWFKNTAIISSEDGHIVVAVPNIFTKTWLEKKYHEDIESALAKMIHRIESIEYKVSDAPVAPATVPAAAPKSAPTTMELSSAELPAAAPVVMSDGSITLNSRYTFDNFVVGSSNELAYAACQAAAKSPGVKYNPLFLYGGVGLGKTHLMQAVGNEILRADPKKRVQYVSSETFTSEFIKSVGQKSTNKFADKYRKVDVLIVDDIQFIAGKEKTVEEFFHTFNALHQSNKQIILSSDRPPRAIAGLEDRMRTRFEMGMTADIQAPDYETRAAILQSKAAAQGFFLPMETVEFMARNIQSNIRELEGALVQLIAHCELRGLEPTVAVATGILGSIAANKPKIKPLTPKLILEKTAVYFDLSLDDLTGPKRDKEIVVPRQIAMYLMRAELSLSFPKIAQVVGGRDHTTAMHSVQKIEKHVEVDEQLRSEISLIKEKLFN